MPTSPPAFPTLVDLLAHNAETHGDDAAVIADDAIHSHASLYEAIRRQAAALAALGVQTGDRVVLLAGNRTEVLVLLGKGLSNAEIGGALFIAEQTVKTHVGRILAKLQLRDRVQAVIFAYDTGLAEPAS